MIFIESPAGVGYSYDENCDYATSDDLVRKKKQLIKNMLTTQARDPAKKRKKRSSEQILSYFTYISKISFSQLFSELPPPPEKLKTKIKSFFLAPAPLTNSWKRACNLHTYSTQYLKH